MQLGSPSLSRQEVCNPLICILVPWLFHMQTKNWKKERGPGTFVMSQVELELNLTLMWVHLVGGARLEMHMSFVLNLDHWANVLTR